MITIDNPIEHESYEEKIKRLGITGYPQVFAKLEDAEDEDKKKYSIIKSAETLIKTVLQDGTTFFTKDKNGIIVNFNSPVYFLDQGEFLLEVEQATVGELFTRKIIYTLNKTEFALSNENYRFNQYEMKIHPVSSRIYKPQNFTRFIHDFFFSQREKKNDGKKRNGISVFKYPQTKPLPFTLAFIKFCKTKISDRLESWFVAYYSNIYLTERLNDFEPQLEFLHWKNAQKYEKIERVVWHDVMYWIIANIFSFALRAKERVVFPSKDLFYFFVNGQRIEIDREVLARKKNVIINKFLIKPCSHLTNPRLRDLHLEGDFYVCNHGNKVLCNHIVLMIDRKNFEKHFSDFAVEISDGSTICKICGAVLLKNPDFIKLSSGFSNLDDIKKYVFNKTIGVVARIEFSEVVSPEFISKFAGNIVETIDPSIRQYFYDFERLKGITPEVLGTLKEILTVVHVHCALFLMIQKHVTFIYYKGIKSGDFAAIKRRMIGDLMDSLNVQLNKVKIFKALNLDNVFSIILEKIGGAPIRIPKELHKHNPRETVLFRYFSGEHLHPFSLSALSSPTQNVGEGGERDGGEMKESFDSILKALYDLPKSIGSAKVQDGTAKIIISQEFYDWIEKLKPFQKKAYDYLLGKCILRLVRAEQIPYEQLRYEEKYIGYVFGTKGIFHRHSFSFLPKGKKENGEEGGKKESEEVCKICGEERAPKEGLVDAINKYMIQDSKRKFFKNYCPVNYKHEWSTPSSSRSDEENKKEKICKLCGYGTEEFFEKNQLPSKKINLKPQTENIVYYNRLQNEKEIEVFPKYVGSLPKESYQNFWKTFCQYEDVTYKNLLAGKTGNKTIALPKLLFQFTAFAIFLGRVINLKNFPIKAFEPFYEEFTTSSKRGLLEEITAFIAECEKIYMLEDPEKFYEHVKKKYITFFNALPPKTQEYWGKELIKLTERSALSEDDVKATALISYKTKVLDETIESTPEKNNFNYEGMDYDGHNEEMA